ncbi:ribonuclease E [Shewanella mesophila]|uniref:ribonuclease E n=1 Tax=Shewanella mesophila TaxID=2864208 RepID=UPI001C657F43|nr:ribonuclease E [Shewanella mesophila]QYJ84833.1 ribonuclease E [Shewanella mesophila]
MKRMLINATQSEELRVALVDGQQLYDLDIESPGHEQKKANIYKGKITRVEPSLEAAFVDYGADRHGFLPLKEIAREYFPKGYSFQGRPNIKEVIKEGQEVIVQIDKEERGNKGAALTTFISLAGSYLVLMPNNPRAGGISRRIEGDERTELKAALSELEVPQGMGLIVRTAGVGKEATELKWDLKVLQHHWTAIEEAAKTRPAPFLIHQESNVIVRAIRDYLRRDVGEVLIDHPRIYEQAKEHVSLVRPDFVDRIKRYEAEVPLFTHFQIETQIESAFQREVRLPSGGSIVIDPTEALTSIDINSARATKGGDIEETALNTNLEAADEIARQLRLRDLGGLVVIDFIDMTPVRHQREVENRMRDAVHHDRARVQLGRISRFGLMEMSRQRLRPSLEESAAHLCPRCHGQGTIRGTESLALSILRLMEEEAIKENTSQIEAVVPVDVAAFLLNEKRKAIRITEERHDVEVYVIPDPNMTTPDYRVSRHRKDDQISESSYKLLEKQEAKLYEPRKLERAASPEPALKGYAAPKQTAAPAPTAPTPKVVEKASTPGILSKLLSAIGNLFSSDEPKSEEKTKEQPRRNTQSRNTGRRNTRRNDNRRGRDESETKETENKRTRGPKADNNESRPAKGRNDNKRGKRDDAKAVNQQTTAEETKEEQQPKQEAARERRQRRNMRRKVRVQTEQQKEQEAALALEAQDKVVSVETKETESTAKNEDKAPRTKRQPRKAKPKQEQTATQEADVSQEVVANSKTEVAETADSSAVDTEVKVAVEAKADSQVTEANSPAIEAVDSNNEAEIDADGKREPRDGQRRSRRSPRHLRAAGQRRRRDEDTGNESNNENVQPAFIPNDVETAPILDTDTQVVVEAQSTEKDFAANVEVTATVDTKEQAEVTVESETVQSAEPVTELVAEVSEQPLENDEIKTEAKPKPKAKRRVSSSSAASSTTKTAKSEITPDAEATPVESDEPAAVNVPVQQAAPAVEATDKTDAETNVAIQTEAKVTESADSESVDKTELTAPEVITEARTSHSEEVIASEDNVSKNTVSEDEAVENKVTKTNVKVAQPAASISVSAPMAKPAAIAIPSSLAPVPAKPKAESTPETEPTKVAAKPTSRFGTMVSSTMAKPTIEARANVEVPTGRQYQATEHEEGKEPTSRGNSAASDMARP